MEDGGPISGYVFFIILLLIHMFFYGFDTAIHNLNYKDIVNKAENKNKKAQRLSLFITKPDEYTNTLQLIITLIHLIIGGFFLSELILFAYHLLENQGGAEVRTTVIRGFSLLGSIAIIVAIAMLMYILLTLGMLLPKRIAAKYPEKWAYFGITPVYYMTLILHPLTTIISVTTKGILFLLGIHAKVENGDVTEAEIISMVNEGHEQGVLLATEAEMITNIFQYGDKEAKDIMTHRNNIIAIDKTMTLREATDYMLSESKSRFPVYEDNIDNIIGVLHFRDAMRAHVNEEWMDKPICDIEGPIRAAIFVPETKNIDGLFQVMQQEKMQMVIVIDEYGQTAGLITMEDILEEIVGNIMDEYDEDEEYIEETDNEDEYIIEGKTPLEELEERFHISFDEDEFETLNGFLIAKIDKIPDEDEEFDINVDGYNFKILSVENKMINSVLVTRIPNTAIEIDKKAHHSGDETDHE